MIIRNITRRGQRLDNAFEAVDSLENRLGRCDVQPCLMEHTMPHRPLQICITAQGEPGVQQQLWAAAMARAMAVARSSGLKARVYAQCAVGDDALLERLTGMGMKNDDALVRMRRRAAPGPSTVMLPAGCTLTTDTLQDISGRRAIVERCQRVFGSEDGRAWLDGSMEQPLFARLLLTAPSGLAGDALCWADGMSHNGVIGQVYTDPAWRGRGVASYLMEAARQYFAANRLPPAYAGAARFSADRLNDHINECVADVRLSMTPAMGLLAKSGYWRGETLMHLPGIDMD